jgi:fatty-acyl-CoA synthase
LLVRHLLHTPLATAPTREIVYGAQVRHDYLRLRERIGRLASGLAGLGVRPGDTVAVMDWDSHRYLECFFAVPMMGAVLHTINIRLAPEQILYTINHAEDDVILVHADFLPLLREIATGFAHPPRLVLLSDANEAPEGAPPIEYEALLADGAPDHPFGDFDEGTRATTFYTTGTTGEPKGVAYSHRQIVLHTLGALGGLASAGDHGRLHRDDVYMPITPMFHVHAWGVPYVATLLGVKQVYPGRYDPLRLAQLIAREGVTFSHCVPTILHMLLTCEAAHDVDLEGWKVVVGGSALPRGLARAAMARGIDVFAGYGMSETCPVLTLGQLERAALQGDPDLQLERRCATGRPLPMVELEVVDEDMRALPHDGESVGEVVVRAPWATPGYVKNPEGSAALWRGGYLHTGDMGTIDAEGYLRVSDRLKDVIKSGGEWVSSLAIEDHVSQLDCVAEVAAIGVPDEKWGERPLVLVVSAPGHDDALTLDRVRAHLVASVEAGTLSRWAVPERIEAVAVIAKTSVGKIDKKRLRQDHADI